MADKFTFGSAGLIHEFEMALDRNGCESQAEVKEMTKGDFLAKVLGVLRGVMEIVPRKFPTWRKIQVGVHGSVAAIQRTLADGGFRVSGYASQILTKMKVVKVLTELELVVVSVAELGFVNGATFAKIVERARQLGLELCPAEVGPALRLAYRDQPLGEWLRLAMEPVADSGGRLRVFLVEHGGGSLWLRAGWFGPQDVWRPGSRWVFVRSRK